MIALVLIAAAFCSLQGDWEKFKLRYGKRYTKEEEDMRLAIFIDNLHFSELMNKLDKSATYGITAFSDLTSEEFAQRHLGFIPQNLEAPAECEEPTQVEIEDIPASFDWVVKGVVSPVQDQGNCGSCWAFATVAAVESAWAISKGELVKLSEQQLVDCDNKNGGCDGGNMVPAEVYVEKNGLCAEKDYPYKAVGGKCKKCDSVVHTKGHCYINPKKVTLPIEDVMKYDCYRYGPIVIGLNATPLQSYVSGVFNPKVCPEAGVNHAVLAVGYQVDTETPYWKVRNSWGSSWGEQGYFRIAYGSNVCGLASGPSFVLA